MCWQLPELLVNVPGLAYGIAGSVAVIIVIAKSSRGPNLDAFPAVNSSNWLDAWWAGFKYLTNAQDVIQEGYEKYKSAPFKVAEPNRWTVIFSNRGHLEELAKASDTEFSLAEAVNDQIRLEDTVGPEVHYNPYHVTAVRVHLTRNMDVLHPQIRDEVVTSFTEVLDLTGNGEEYCSTYVYYALIWEHSEWKTAGVECRRKDCRDPDWMDLNIRCSSDLMQGGIMVGLFPKFMRPLAIRFLTNVPGSIGRGVKLLSPIIEERLKYLNEYGTEWDDMPNDLVSWLMKEADGPELTAERLTTRVILVIFAAVHVFTQALFYLAANPQYIQPLREEVEGIVEKHGWTKIALGKMRKVDSFLKECQRIEGMNIVTLTRKASKDFTFSDGRFIPKGTSVAAAARSLHHDKNIYDNPELFEPFRFAHVSEDDGKGVKYQFASTSIEYLSFGHGRHACPGRAFAANTLKSMLAHVVVTYDVKLEDNATLPPSLHTGAFTQANLRAKVMFRNRVV
ncbi:cytochrome P450 [Boletus coccyginus]|nr:cytochrome P450 [Boletus coccyginus]